jgi:hypothetical protein
LDVGKDKSKGKVSDLDKVISDWESKLSIAEVNKNKQEVLAIKLILDYWRSKKKKGH